MAKIISVKINQREIDKFGNIFRKNFKNNYNKNLYSATAAVKTAMVTEMSTKMKIKNKNYPKSISAKYYNNRKDKIGFKTLYLYPKLNMMRVQAIGGVAKANHYDNLIVVNKQHFKTKKSALKYIDRYKQRIYFRKLKNGNYVAIHKMKNKKTKLIATYTPKVYIKKRFDFFNTAKKAAYKQINNNIRLYLSNYN